MKKMNKRGFFLVETMVVIAVVGVVLTFLFRTFSNLYTRFNASEYYNTVNTINAASNIKQYIDKLDVSYEDLLNGNSYVEITNDNVLVNNHYTLLKSKLNILKIYLINIQSFFLNSNNLNNFNIDFRRYLKTLSKDKAQYKIIVINKNNEYGSIASFDYYLTLTGDEDDEYALYVPLNGTFVEPGYEAKDNNGNDLETLITGVVDTNTAGTYYLNYSTGAITLRRKVVVYKKIYNYDYAGNYQTFTAPISGNYKIELWGAGVPNGKGAYTKGELYLFKGQTLYVYVGQSNSTLNAESFNGGIGSNEGAPGGGATDIRLISGNWKDLNGLRSRIMVAAGGGVGSVAGAHGGALTGLAAGSSTGGSQTAPGTADSSNYYQASFGIGGGGCGGGGGYYGGGGATCATGGAGGSSFISGYTGCNAINRSGTHTGQPIHYSGYKFTNMEMIAGNASMPNPRGSGNITGNNGQGYARITLLDINSNHTLKSVRYIYNQISGNSTDTENHWVELQVFDNNGENISNGSTTISSSYQNGNTEYWRPLTDGVITTDSYINSSTGLQWVRLDLGREYELSSIRLWHYYGDGRTYNDNEIRVAKEDLSYTTVNNTSYPETSDGLIIRPIPMD